MNFKFLMGCALLIAVSLQSPAFAAAPAKKKPVKTIHTKDLRTSLKPGTAPGRTAVPVANDGDLSPSGYSIKMKPKGAKYARTTASVRPPARTVANARVANMNEPISNYIRTIRVGYNGPVPQLAIGQALAVNDSYIVTSADFVSDAWTNSGNVHFFVPDSTQALSLVGFDLGSNLAIFSTGLGSHMEHTLPLQRLRVEAPTNTEDYAALSSSGFFAGARRVRPVQDLTFVRERFELPASVVLNSSGASSPGVQFLFDKNGRWTGSVSLLDQRDGRRFDVTSSNQAYEMIRQLEQRPPQVLPMTVLQQQAASWQERWTNTFFESAKKGLALRSLDCEANALHVDDPTVAASLVRTRLLHCSNTMPVSVTRDYAMGVELITGDVMYKDSVKAYLSHDLTPTTVFAAGASGHRAPASINVMTGPECERSDVTNSHHHHLHVRFCTSALKNVAGLNDTTITVVSSDTGQVSTLHSIHLRGFDPKNAKRFMEWMIETETIQ